jgi:non-ribosomal peptide synthetase component F
MIEDSEAPVVLTSAALAAGPRRIRTRVIPLTAMPRSSSSKARRIPRRLEPPGPHYVIYTSGSTGLLLGAEIPTRD